MAIIKEKNKLTVKKIVVVGGGTAGWLSALYFKKYHNEQEIIMVESSKIGILGAGEGSTPSLMGFLLKDLQIDEVEFLNRVNGTKKYGIIFEGWNENIKHSFLHAFVKGESQNKTTYSYHFNARLFAEYLKEKSIERGVKYLDNEVKDFNLKDNQISKINFEDGTSLDVDFVIDSSGFKRLIIGELYKSNWVSFEKELIVNSAVPFFISQTKIEESPSTIAIASDYGWIWQIPLQDRWGCGYIFSDQYVNEEQIIDEIKKKYGNQITQINKQIKFKAGCYEKVWIENCIAIGLSGGFLEPLEATSIATTITQLRKIPRNIFDYEKRDVYNEFVYNLNYQNMMFLRHHYNCSRNDTEFWKTYRNMKIPSELNEIYQIPVTNKTISQILKIKGDTINFLLSQYMLIHTNNFIKKNKNLI